MYMSSDITGTELPFQTNHREGMYHETSLVQSSFPTDHSEGTSLVQTSQLSFQTNHSKGQHLQVPPTQQYQKQNKTPWKKSAVIPCKVQKKENKLISGLCVELADERELKSQTSSLSVSLLCKVGLFFHIRTLFHAPGNDLLTWNIMGVEALEKLKLLKR